MRRDTITLGRDYRLRYSQAGLYRVRAISWVTNHALDGKTRTMLKVEYHDEETGGRLDGHPQYVISAAELAGPWDDVEEKAKRLTRERQGSVVLGLRHELKLLGVEATVEPKRGSTTRVVVELNVTEGETLIRLLGGIER